MEHPSIIAQKKRIRNYGIVFISFLIVSVVFSLVDFGTDIINGRTVTHPDTEIPSLSEYFPTDKCAVSFIYVVSIICFIIFSIKMIARAVRNSFIDATIDKYIVKMGACLVLAGLSGSIWTEILIKETGNGANLVILTSGIMLILLSEMFKLARLYKTDSELSI